MAEIAELAKKNTALRERVNELEKKLEDKKTRVSDLEEKINRSNEKLVKARAALAEREKKKTANNVFDIRDIEKIGEFRVVPAAHFMPGNKRRIPDNPAERYKHCLSTNDYNVQPDFRGYFEGDFLGFSQRVLFAVHRKADADASVPTPTMHSLYELVQRGGVACLEQIKDSLRDDETGEVPRRTKKFLDLLQSSLVIAPNTRGDSDSDTSDEDEKPKRQRKPPMRKRKRDTDEEEEKAVKKRPAAIKAPRSSRKPPPPSSSSDSSSSSSDSSSEDEKETPQTNLVLYTGSRAEEQTGKTELVVYEGKEETKVVPYEKAAEETKVVPYEKAAEETKVVPCEEAVDQTNLIVHVEERGEEEKEPEKEKKEKKKKDKKKKQANSDDDFDIYGDC